MINQKSEYPLIIGGFYRTGTTLLRRLLDAHSNIHCGPEVKFFKDFHGDYLKDGLKHVRFFKTIKSLGLKRDELLKIFGKAFIETHELAARKLKKKRWADKTPENVLYLDEWASLLNDKFFFVHVVRNPLDVLASLNERGFEKTVPKEFEKKVELHKIFLKRGLDFSKKHSDISLTIRYEDLVKDPEKCLTALMMSIGENFEPSVLKNFNNAKRQSGIEDPKVKLRKDIHTESIDRWKRELDENQIKLATLELGPLASKFGYRYKRVDT